MFFWLIQRFAWEEMGTNRSTTEEIDVNSDAVDEVVCLSNDRNPTIPMQVDGSETAAAVETRGTPKKKDRNTNVKRWKYWHCECGPGTSTNQVVKEADPKGAKVQPCKRRRKSKKCRCEAGFAGYLNKDGLWEIHKVELTHKNHVPTPSKSRFIPSYKDVPKFVLRVAKDLMDAGKERSKEFGETDCRTMFEYFAKMKEANEDLFFSWRVDEANKLMDVVWVDARSRVAYMDFCDVVCFDATYITNHYELPFANFVGVDHHGQTILLGCALVRNEDTEIQVGNARVARVHGWCPARCKVPRKLLAVKKVGEVHKKMKDVVYDSLSIEEFECRWIERIRSFNLNEWLNSLWEEQSHRVLAYVKDTFWAS
ncbi:Protein FAR1-RELATED SEQUENCE 3 [Bienertia sinuspersici]